MANVFQMYHQLGVRSQNWHRFLQMCPADLEEFKKS
jgi:hypothetical protein